MTNKVRDYNIFKKEIDLLADGHWLIDEEKDVEYLDGSKSLIQYTRQ